MYKAWLSAKPTKKTVIQTNFCPNVIKAVIDLIPLTAPRNSSLDRVAVTFWTTFFHKNRNGFKERCCSQEKDKQIVQSMYSCQAFHGYQAGENLNHPASETSYKCPQCAVSLGVAPSFSQYNQYKDYGNEYKEIKSNKGNTD